MFLEICPKLADFSMLDLNKSIEANSTGLPMVAGNTYRKSGARRTNDAKGSIIRKLPVINSECGCAKIFGQPGMSDKGRAALAGPQTDGI